MGTLDLDGHRLLASGRDADVYEYGEGRVLRRYRDGWEAGPEAGVMRHLALLGYPVPTVHEVAGADLVMDRVEGPTMVEAVRSGELDPVAAARTLAHLHDRLHALPASSGVPDRRVLHLDLHPENVLVAADGPVVIDWRNAQEGPAELDIAVTSLILAHVAVDARDERAPLAATMLHAFLEHAAESPGPQLGTALARRASDALSDYERGLLDAAGDLVRSLS